MNSGTRNKSILKSTQRCQAFKVAKNKNYKTQSITNFQKIIKKLFFKQSLHLILKIWKIININQRTINSNVINAWWLVTKRSSYQFEFDLFPPKKRWNKVNKSNMQSFKSKIVWGIIKKSNASSWEEKKIGELCLHGIRVLGG